MKSILVIFVLTFLCSSFEILETKEITIIGQAVDYKTGKAVPNVRLGLMYNPGAQDSTIEHALCVTDSMGNFKYSARLNIQSPIFTIVNNEHAHIEYSITHLSDTIRISKHYLISYDSDYKAMSDDPDAMCIPLFGNLKGDSIPMVVEYVQENHLGLIANQIDTVQMAHTASNSGAKCIFKYKFLSFKSTL
jgi:hypothetical protein